MSDSTQSPPSDPTQSPPEALPPAFPLNRTFLDVETTGLNPYSQEIIEIAFLVEAPPETPDGIGKILDRWSSKVKPLHLGTANSKALQVNGYDPEKWKDAPTFAEIAPKVARYLKQATVLIGHNPTFDTRFITAALEREGIFGVYIPYHQIDTVTSAFMALNWMIPNDQKLRLDMLRDHFGIPKDDHHEAFKDVVDCRQILYLTRGVLTGVQYDRTILSAA